MIPSGGLGICLASQATFIAFISTAYKKEPITGWSSMILGEPCDPAIVETTYSEGVNNKMIRPLV